MLSEVLAALEPERGGAYLDGTVGGGGHAEAILDRGEMATLWGVDRDPDAVTAAAARLARFGDRARVRRADFRDLPEALGSEATQLEDLAGVLLDLGISSHQVDTTARGFSFRPATPLDMRKEARRRSPERGDRRGAGGDLPGLWRDSKLAAPGRRGGGAAPRASFPLQRRSRRGQSKSLRVAGRTWRARPGLPGRQDRRERRARGAGGRSPASS